MLQCYKVKRYRMPPAVVCVAPSSAGLQSTNYKLQHSANAPICYCDKHDQRTIAIFVKQQQTIQSIRQAISSTSHEMQKIKLKRVTLYQLELYPTSNEQIDAPHPHRSWWLTAPYELYILINYLISLAHVQGKRYCIVLLIIQKMQKLTVYHTQATLSTMHNKSDLR